MAATHPLLQEYKPSDSDRFDRIKAAHLLNRAGFGGTDSEISAIQKLGPGRAVDQLLDFPDAPAEEQSKTDVPDLSSIEGYPTSFRQLQQMVRGKTEEDKKQLLQQFMQANREALVATGAWWVKRMIGGPHPLQEKLTLFWHGHFTTSAKDERSAMLMWQQNELLRRQSAANFRAFVHAISRDPAMLDYLNNTQNHKAHPNENYARELMELFTLGIGNYTESDIKEAARAFSGWTHDGDQFVFRQGDHDDGQKTFFGKRGNFDGDDIIEGILAAPACPRYVASKIYKYFVSEQIDDPLAEALGAILRQSNYDLRPLLRTIFTSKGFYAHATIGNQIKSPIQLIVGTIRLLGVEMPQTIVLAGALTQMGQVPFAPPNVKGWPGGRAWINTSTTFVRYNTCVWLAGGFSGKMPMNPMGKQALTKGNLKEGRSGEIDFNPPNARSADDAVDYWVARLIQRPIDDEKRKVLIDSIGSNAPSESDVKRMVQLIVSMPEYQLC